MLREGQLCGHYRLVRLLKKGGMGEVHLAEDTRLQRYVAIKVIHTDVTYSANPAEGHEAIRLFLREAQAIAQLDHIHILPLYDSGEDQINDQTVTFMVMPYRQEGSFGDWVRTHSSKGILPLAAVERIVRQAAEALQHAHDRYIIHKDVKPSNFLVRGHAEHPSQLELQLADFGVAKIMPQSSESQAIRGTPRYMAPEQWEGQPVPATDQYALAVMAYELLTGQPPFPGQEHEQLWHQHSHVPPHAPGTINAMVPQEIDNVLLRALSKKPANRYPTILAFAHAFQRAVINSGNIQQTISISSFEAQMGTNRIITLSDGRQVTVPIPAGAYQGQIMRMEGYGLPTIYDGTKGALIVIIVVAIMEPPVQPQQRYMEPTVPVVLPVVADIPSLPPRPTSPMGPSSRKHKPMKLVAMIGAVFLLAVSTLCVMAMWKNIISDTQVLATSTALTATAVRQTETAQVRATSAAQIQATATVQAQATMTVVQANPYPSYFSGGGGPLVFYDPLTSANERYSWIPTSTNLPMNNGNCVYKDGGLTASVNGDNNWAIYFHTCSANNTNYSDFAYEVNVTLMMGDCGGVTLRGHDAGFYYFIICQDGRYRIVRYTHDPGVNVTPSPTLNPILKDSSSQYIKVNLGQNNLVGVRAQGSKIDFYVNQLPVDSIVDASYSEGSIGVIAKSWDLNDPTQAVFTTARVWSLQS